MFSILKSKKFTISFEPQSSFWAGSVVNMLHFLTGTSVLCPEEAQRMRVRDIGRQIFREKKGDIVCGAQSSDHVHIFFSLPHQCCDFRSGVQDKVPFDPPNIICVPIYL